MAKQRMKIREAMQLWLAAREADGLARSTLDNQRSHFRKLGRAVWDWEQAHRRWQPMWADEADGQLVTLYLARCKGQAGNRANMLAALRAFLRYCERNDWLTAGATDKLLHGKRSAQGQRATKVWISPDKFPKLLDCQTRHPSDRMTMALLLYTLCRKSELYALRWEHVDFKRKELKVWRPKTKRWTTVGIERNLMAELEDYALWYAAEMGTDGYLDPDWHVLPELINHPKWDPATKKYGGCGWYSINPERHPFHMEKIVKRALDAIGEDRTRHGKTQRHVGEGAHTIRRSGARALLKSLSARYGYGDALDTVRAMLDHQDTKVTLQYIGMEQTKDELNEWLKTNDMYGVTPQWEGAA